MHDIIHDFTTSLAFENNLDAETATRLVTWLNNEGVLDYDILKETYIKPTFQANDNTEQVVGA